MLFGLLIIPDPLKNYSYLLIISLFYHKLSQTCYFVEFEYEIDCTDMQLKIDCFNLKNQIFLR